MVYNSIMGDFDYLVSVRRALHKMPELSEREYETGAFIASELKRMGHKFRKLGTGIVCDVKGVKQDSTIALRCDIDALPIEEKADCAFRSQNGNMHACGHDGHTAMLLCVAKELATRRPRKNVRLIFQFGEEGDGGADKMIGMGAIEGVSEIYALHLCPELEIGRFASTEGAMFAGTVEFDVSIGGKSCHCADISAGNDALRAAVHFYRSASDCNADCKNNTLFHIGKLCGGTARNIVASEAVAYCTLRYFDVSDMDKLMMRLESCLVEGDNLFGTDHRLVVNAVYPPLINCPAALDKLRAYVKVEPCAPRYTAEDFAFYLQKIPGCMLWLGCKDEKYGAPLHSNLFGFDETALVPGVELFEKLIF